MVPAGATTAWSCHLCCCLLPLNAVFDDARILLALLLMLLFVLLLLEMFFKRALLMLFELQLDFLSIAAQGCSSTRAVDVRFQF